MQHQKIIFSNNIAKELGKIIDSITHNKLFILSDENSGKYALPLIGDEICNKANVITIPAGDANKNLETLSFVWSELQKGGATRNSLMINLGGGVVTDLGGFAATTFKRGIRFINVPTTLLSAVDAAVGGKTGINFNGLKNEIGAFHEADAVLIATAFLKTLPENEIKSGYAEMLKHGLLSNYKSYRKLIEYNISELSEDRLLSLLEESVGVKRNIVEQDPLEKGLRKALNLGHTAGHAFESMALKSGKPIPHGYAIAWGLIVEMILSKLIKDLDSNILYELADYTYSHYGAFNITCNDYTTLCNFMKHDKKSENGEYNFTLISNPGTVHVDCIVSEDDVKTALDIYRDLMHI